jgi:hypothetical protein
MPKKVKTAILVMILTIVGMPAITSVARMNAMVADLETEFRKGQYGDNLSIYEDLIDKAEIADNLAALCVSADLLPADEEHLTAIRETSAAIRQEDSIAALYQLSETLDANVEWVDAALETADTLSGTHHELWIKYRSEYLSEQTTISSDPYNSLVDDYYQETAGFPASMYRALARQAEYFR